MENKKKKIGGTKRKKQARNTNIGTFSASLFGTACGLFTAVLFAVICSFVCLRSNMPDRLTTPLAYVCSVVSYLTAGYYAVRKRGGAAIPCGALSGIVLTVVFFICSLFIKSDAVGSVGLSVGMLIRFTMVAVSMLGAVLGALRKK